jgi:hypothetical protein
MPRKPVSPVKKSPMLENVRIRMCRQGLGDFFLLTFTNQLQQKFNLLIDCGVLTASGGDGRLKMIAQKLLAECGGHLNAVVVTHEHSDHISGFAKKNFTWIRPDGQELLPKIDQVWMAWTENPEDDQVKEIIKKVNALSYAVIGAALVMNDEERVQIQEILHFQGIDLHADILLNAGGDINTAGKAKYGSTNLLNTAKCDRFARVWSEILLSRPITRYAHAWRTSTR